MENVIYALIPITALSIPIVAILAGPLKRWISIQERKVELAATTAGEAAAQYAAKIERLESRVQVLERIVTDKGTALSAEIENLRLPPLN
jgi:hypothetical protein